MRVNVIEKAARSLSSVAPNPLFLRDEELTGGSTCWMPPTGP